jgi:hypothetical protein
MMKLDDRESKIANITPFGLRLQPDLKRKIEEAAKRNGRSLNSEIAARLEASLDSDSDARSTAAANRLLRSGMGDDLERRVRALEQALQNINLADRTYDFEMRLTRLEADRR